MGAPFSIEAASPKKGRFDPTGVEAAWARPLRLRLHGKGDK